MDARGLKIATLLFVVLVLVIVETLALLAQPRLTGDGLLTGWRVVAVRKTVCYNPMIDTKEQTISCP